MPVLKLRAAVVADDRDRLRPERLEADDAVERRVDGRAVRARDVDAEVEALLHALRRHPDARVAEEPADGVLAVKRLDRPAVAGRRSSGGGCFRDEDGAREERRDGGDDRRECPRPGAAGREKWVRGSHAATLGPARNGPKTAASRPDNGLRSPPERAIRTPSAGGGTTAVHAGISDPRPARGVERGRADRPRRAAPARPPGRPAPARRSGRPDGAARRRALRRRAAEDGDGVAAELRRRAAEGARPGRARHAPARLRARGRRPEQIDARRFEQLLADARSAAPEERRALLVRRARALARAAASRVRLRRLGAGRDPPARRAPARRRTRSGSRPTSSSAATADVVAELEALVREHPLRERPRELLMLALYRAGRQAEALAAYQRRTRALLDELGIEPGRRLQELQASILRQERRLCPGRNGAEHDAEAEIVKALARGPRRAGARARRRGRPRRRARRRASATRATGRSTSPASRSTSRR